MALRQIFLDTETTGLSPANGDRIVEIAAIEAVEGHLTGRHFHTYLNPDCLINPHAQRVHGLTIEFLRDKPRFHEISQSFCAFVLGSECLIHNAPFDTKFINAEMEAMGSAQRLSQLASIVCTLSLAKTLFPGQKASLDDLLHRAGNTKTRGKHSALEDTRLLSEVYFKLLRKRT